ncbi:MAG: hypothetical protein JW720_01645 [Sedimentisphaerales bacterium]|nr:hypothetical protein [Sedimentisphaerales bacterium]
MKTSGLKRVIVLVLLVSISGAPARAASKSAADPLAAVPADCAFCLRINNFEWTVSQADQFLAGISPVPLGLSMLVRMQFGQILGDPQLSGIDMNAAFAAFGMPMPAGSSEPVFVAILVPVKDYDALLAAPNVGPPDADGIAKITVAGAEIMIVTQAGQYALVTGAQYAAMLKSTAAEISSATTKMLPSLPGISTSDVAKAPIWLYLDGPKTAAAVAPMASQMASQMPASPGMSPQNQAGSIMPNMANLDITVAAKDMPVQSVTLGLEPSPDVLKIMGRISAVPGSELADTFVRNSAKLQPLFGMIGAKAPAQLGPDLAAVTTMLPQAANANLAGKLDLMQLFGILAMVAPVPMPKLDPAKPSKSAMAYAVSVGAGEMAVDIALPKEHVIEIIAAAGSADAANAADAAADTAEMDMNTLLKEEQPQDDISMITASPFAEVTASPTDEIVITPMQDQTNPFDTGLGALDDDVAVAAPQNQAVRVVGARLITFADLKLGILPLGQAQGYTLSLVAELPAPAVKIAGGQIEKALTDTGKSLLQPKQWDRRIKFTRLSNDYKTAIFDIELLLPDQTATGLEELSGKIDYLTAAGTKNVDLGLMTLKPDTLGPELGARIVAVEADPYQNNAAIVALDLKLPPEAVESVELYTKDDRAIEIRRRGSISLGQITTVKFSVHEELPQQARIVVHTFDQIRKEQMPFTITDISLTGRPTR